MILSGRCLGVGPSYGSPVEVGEAELIIDDETVKMRLATGMNIFIVFDEPLSSMTEMSTAEIAAEYPHGADTNGIQGWRVGETDYRILLLADLPGYEQAARVAVLGVPGEKDIDTAMLYTPEQVAAGYYELALAEFEASTAPLTVPRLTGGER